MSTIHDWDFLADNNDTADKEVQWPEGMEPKRLNDSGRGVMARVREYVADVGGSLVGTVTNDEEAKTSHIAIKSRTKFRHIPDGTVLRFRASAKVLGAATLGVNDIMPRPLMMSIELGYGDLEEGSIQAGGVYEVVYVVRDEGDRLGHWVLMNPTYLPPPPEPIQRLIPAGTIAAFAMQAIPRGWLLCDGREVSREQYKDLLDVIGLTYGIGDGDKTFNLPDFRGVFLRGWDNGRGLDRNREFGTLQADEVMRHKHGFSVGKGIFTYTTSSTSVHDRSKRSAEESSAYDDDSTVEVKVREPRQGLEEEDQIELNLEDYLDQETIERFGMLREWGGSLLNPKSPFVKLVHRIFGPDTDKPPEELLAALRLLLTHHHSFDVREAGGIETRPRNASIMFAIRY